MAAERERRSQVGGLLRHEEVPFFMTLTWLLRRPRAASVIRVDEHFLRARAVVNAEDPIGLLAMGAPEDEYDPEVEDLLSRSTAVTQARVREVFLKWFGKDTGRLDGPTVERIAAGLEALRKGTGEHP